MRAFPGPEDTRRWQLGCGLEWWYVHGEAASAGNRPVPFMVALFRQTVGAAVPPRHGFAALVAVLEPEGAARAESRVSPELVAWMQEALRERGWPGLGRLGTSRAFDAPGVVAGGCAQVAGAGWSPDARSFAWASLRFRTGRAGFRLCFAEPGTRRLWRLRVQAPAPPMLLPLPECDDPDSGAMHYACWPRLELAGRRGRADVTGVAWVDHQWGGHGWLAEPGADVEPLGWEWLGAWLDDGSSWVVLTRRDPATGAQRARWAAVKDAAGRIRGSSEVATGAVDWWESPRTHVRYPVGWQVVLPELAAELTFTAADEDQEIPLPGPMRAVWQGRGEVQARVGGVELGGLARLELHGYGYTQDLAATVRGWGDRVDSALADALPRRLDRQAVAAWTGEADRPLDSAALTATIAGPAWDLLDRPAKRWRPLLALGLLEALGADSRLYEDLVCPLAELTHAGSLVVDDIEDEAELRRGGPAIHRRYGVPVALNLGNTLYFLPQLGIASHPRVSDRQRLAIYEVVVRQLVRAHLGQAQDLRWSGQMSEKQLAEWVAEGEVDERILEMYALKTGAPAEAAAELACVLAGATSETAVACRWFARALGTAFQIVDDLQGFERSASDAGGEAWEDLRQRKLTLVLVRALRGLPEADAARLAAIVAEARSEDTSEGVELIRRSGAVASCRKAALRLVEEPWHELASVLPPGDAVLRLLLLSRFLLGQ